MSFFGNEDGSPGYGADASSVFPTEEIVPGFQLEAESDPQTYMDFDLTTVALPELLQEINTNLIGDLKEGAPDLLKALMKQESTPVEVSSTAQTDEQVRAGPFVENSSLNQPSVGKSEAVLEDTKDFAAISEANPFSSSKTQSNASNTKQENKDSPGDNSSTADVDGAVEGGGAKKKAIRAERNRQSAAASRERKKHHIRELERRVSMLSMENAHLQVEQYDRIRQRIEEEKKLAEENQRLKNQLVFLDMKINQLAKKMDEAGINNRKKENRARTWTPGDFKGKRGQI